jgi:acetyl-CoA synthetase
MFHSVIVVRRTGGPIDWVDGRDIWYHEGIASVASDCPAEPMDAEDPLFILYTSGSTGKPKGVLHTTGGYLLQAAMTHRYVFDYHDGDIYWCTADVGWVTGHSYIVYGPLANGATTLMFEGVPTYPDASRFWQVIDKHQVNIFYTAPTALRALMAAGRPVCDPKLASIACACWARSANRSIRRPGSGTTGWSAKGAARLSTPGGRPKPAAS